MPNKYAKRVHIIRKEALTATICEGQRYFIERYSKKDEPASL
jgi:hypothetical protein